MDPLALATQHVVSERQELLWADAKIDGRAVFGKRESYRLHKERLLSLQADLAKIRLLTKAVLGLEGGENCKLWRYFNVDANCGEVGVHVLTHVAENLASAGPAVGFYQKCLLPKAADRNSGCESRGLSESERKTTSPARAAGVTLVLRKRPLLPAEVADGEWDVVTRFGGGGGGTRISAEEGNSKSFHVHEGRVSYSGRRLDLQVSHHEGDVVLSGSDRLHPVLRDVVGRAGRGLSMDRSSLTLLCYGQTGTGKTYSMREAVEYVLGEWLEGTEQVVQAVSVQCFEVLHKTVFDLLDERKVVKALEDEHRKVHVKARKERVVFGNCSGDESSGAGESLSHSHPDGDTDLTSTRRGVEAVFEQALALRLSEATERNANSSRSHGFFVFEFELMSGTSVTFRVVDLAGSERNFETQQMTAAQHRQSANINSSLMTLKTCMRRLAEQQSTTSGTKSKARIPYRESRLTHLLQDCFSEGADPDADQTCKTGVTTTPPPHETGEQHKLLLLACLSPCARDAVHSRNTLSHVCDMFPHRHSQFEVRLDLPLYVGVEKNPVGIGGGKSSLKDWSEADVERWLGSVAGGRFSRIVLPEGFRDGKGLLRFVGMKAALLQVPESESEGETGAQTERGEEAAGGGEGNENVPSLYELFANEEMRRARVNEEGASWNIAGPENLSKISRLFKALVEVEAGLAASGPKGK
eukprot:g3379.t1